MVIIHQWRISGIVCQEIEKYLLKNHAHNDRYTINRYIMNRDIHLAVHSHKASLSETRRSTRIGA